MLLTQNFMYDAIYRYVDIGRKLMTNMHVCIRKLLLFEGNFFEKSLGSSFRSAILFGELMTMNRHQLRLVFSHFNHYSAESNETMWMKCLPQGRNIHTSE